MQNLHNAQYCDVVIRKELKVVKVPIKSSIYKGVGVPYTIIGKLHGWVFHRGYHYWTLMAPVGRGIPEKDSKKFRASWRDHMCVGMFPEKKPSAVGTIDRFNLETQESLNAFVALLRWPHKRKGELK